MNEDYLNEHNPAIPNFNYVVLSKTTYGKDKNLLKVTYSIANAENVIWGTFSEKQFFKSSEFYQFYMTKAGKFKLDSKYSERDPNRTTVFKEFERIIESLKPQMAEVFRKQLTTNEINDLLGSKNEDEWML